MVRHRDGSYSLSGLIRPDEVREAIGLAVPDDPAYETVAGFMLERLGRLAQLGDRVSVPGAELTVERLERHRIERVRAVARPHRVPIAPVSVRAARAARAARVARAGAEASGPAGARR